MNFKAARCPTCGGALQIPEELSTAKCMYCGGEVIVREAIQLAAGRVRESTVAKPIEKIIDESAPFPVQQLKDQAYTMITIFGLLGGLGLFVALLAKSEFGVFMSVGGLLTAAVIALIFFPRIMRLERANYEMSKIPPSKQLIGYEGPCPYCDTSITLPPNILGADCPACHKRIVIRDSKFHSVDTPVSGLKR